jgi:biopolymer transport protein ExbD
MAQIIESGGGHGKGQKKGRKKHGLPHVDMTPMVDLGFLLLTFFVLTSTFSKPQAMEINMPVPKTDPNEKATPFDVKKTVTLLLSEANTVYYYSGIIGDKVNPAVLEKTDLSKNGLEKVLLDKNAKAYNMIKKLEQKLLNGTVDEAKFKIDRNKILKKKAILVIIKADALAKYKNMVDILDEMQIVNAGTYAIVDITNEELEMIKKYKEEHPL